MADNDLEAFQYYVLRAANAEVLAKAIAEIIETANAEGGREVLLDSKRRKFVPAAAIDTIIPPKFLLSFQTQ